MKDKSRSPEELETIAEWEKLFAEEKRTGGGNPLVEIFTYRIFTSYRAFGRLRKNPMTVELVGLRGGKRLHSIRGNKLPEDLEITVETELGTDDYNEVLGKLRNAQKR